MRNDWLQNIILIFIFDMKKTNFGHTKGKRQRKSNKKIGKIAVIFEWLLSNRFVSHNNNNITDVYFYSIVVIN